MKRILIGLAFAATSTGCAISTQQEVQMGTDYSQQINSQLPIVRDPEVARYINVLGDSIAIEVKGTGRVASSDTKGILALSDEIKLRKRIVVSTEAHSRTLDNGIELMTVPDFLDALWNDELVT